jgi:hypothetical protein
MSSRVRLVALCAEQWKLDRRFQMQPLSQNKHPRMRSIEIYRQGSGPQLLRGDPRYINLSLVSLASRNAAAQVAPAVPPKPSVSVFSGARRQSAGELAGASFTEYSTPQLPDKPDEAYLAESSTEDFTSERSPVDTSMITRASLAPTSESTNSEIEIPLKTHTRNPSFRMSRSPSFSSQSLLSKVFFATVVTIRERQVTCTRRFRRPARRQSSSKSRTHQARFLRT